MFTSTTSRRTGAAIAMASVAALALAGCAQDAGGSDDGGSGGGGIEPTTLTVTSYMNENQAYSVAFKDWAAEVTEATGGAVQFEFFWDGSLCSSLEASKCVEDGVADLAMDVPAFTQSLTASQIGFLPLLTSDYGAVATALGALVDEYDVFEEEYTAHGQHLLFFGPAVTAAVATTAGNEVTQLSDFAGKQIRATSTLGTAFEQLGASPIAGGQESIYESLERGVFVGTSHAFDDLVTAGYTEVAPNVYGLDDIGVYVVLSYVMNLDVWNGLAAEVQEAMTAASSRMTSDGGFSDILSEAIDASCEVTNGEGIEVVSLGGDAEGRAWAEATQEIVVNKWKDNARGVVDDPDGMFDRYLELIEENSTGAAPTIGEQCAALR